MEYLLARPLFLALFLVTSIGPLAAQAPLGREVSVNQTRAGWQHSPDVGVAADGSFVVVWEDDDEERRVWARRYGANGKPRGSELRVSRLGDHQQSAPAVAVWPDGSFVVAWNRVLAEGGPVEVYASRFDAGGRPLGQPRLVGFAGAEGWYEPAAVVILPDGGFFVAWPLEDGGTYWDSGYYPSRDLYGRRFTRDGILVGGRVTLNGDSLGDQREPECSVSQGKELVCAWTSWLGEGYFGEIMFRRFNLDGLPVGEELEVSEAWYLRQGNPGLAVHENGVVLVVWDEGGSTEDVMGRLIDASDRFLTSLYLYAAPQSLQSYPEAAATDEGFVVVWSSAGKVFLRRLSVGGALTSGKLVVNQRRDGFPVVSSMALGPGGGAVVWMVYTPGFDSGDIAARRLR